MPSIGPLELVIVLVIVLIVFGPKKLPGLGRSLGTELDHLAGAARHAGRRAQHAAGVAQARGTGMREFKESITGNSKDDDDERAIEAADDGPSTPEQHDDRISRPRG